MINFKSGALQGSFSARVLGVGPERLALIYTPNTPKLVLKHLNNGYPFTLGQFKHAP